MSHRARFLDMYILFLVYINDLSDKVKSRIRIFAEDTVIYLATSTDGESITLQNDPFLLELWEHVGTWALTPPNVRSYISQKLNGPSKPDTPSTMPMILDTVQSAKYLGVTISDDLSWSSHIDSIYKKANQTLEFLKMNIKVRNKDLTSTAYKTLVRP